MILSLQVCDPNDIHTILNSKHTEFTKSRFYKKMLAFLFPNSMLITDGEEWLRQRKILNRGFHNQYIRHMHTSVWRECEILFRACQGHAAAKTQMDIESQFQGLTLDVL